MEVIQEQYKDTKIGRIPKDWDCLLLSEFATNFRGGASFKPKEFTNDGVKVLSKIGITSGGKMIIPISKQQYCESECLEKYKKSIASKSELITVLRDLVPSGPSIGYIVQIHDDSSYIMAQGVYCFSIDENKVSRNFLIQLSNTNWYRKYMQKILVGSTQVHIRQPVFLKTPIPIPPLPEQQKIAEILSTVDEQISTTQAIIDKSKELKKGLMQKLFSEGIGHTEFKDTKIGRIPKGWEVVKLNEVGLIKVGRDLNKEIYSPTLSKEHKVPVYSNAISCRGLYGFYSTSEYPKNSITITGRGDIGYAFARNEEFGAIGRLIVIQPNSNIDYVFLTNYINHCVNFHIETSGIPQLTGVQASAYKVAIPSLKEQHKIAEILSEADAKIEKEENEKAKLEELKKGLMQQLLTGKKRVKV